MFLTVLASLGIASTVTSFGVFSNVGYIANRINNRVILSRLMTLQTDIQGGDCSVRCPKRALPSKPGSAGLLLILGLQRYV